MVKRSRELFEAEHARTPSDAELVDFHNTRMYATRKDAARQSVLITIRGLGSLRSIPLEDPSLFGEDRLAWTDVPDEGASERTARIRSIVAECARRDAERDGLTPFRRSSRYESRPVTRGRGQGDWSDHDEQQEASHPGAGRP